MGSRDGVVVIPLASIWPGFDPELVATCGLSWLMFVYSSPRGFSLGSPFFPQASISKFQLDRMQDLLENHFRVSGASYVSTINYCYC